MCEGAGETSTNICLLHVSLTTNDSADTAVQPYRKEEACW